jgi:GNAT superfamily N-acetyltransferase
MKDAEALIKCIDAAYAIYKDRIKDLPAVSEGVADDIETHRVWVVELEQSIVGGLILVPHDKYAHLANVAVDPNCFGLGLGRGLIERAEEECRYLGLGEMRLSTHIGLPENVRLYEHLGWRETGRSGNKVHMTKRL